MITLTQDDVELVRELVRQVEGYQYYVEEQHLELGRPEMDAGERIRHAGITSLLHRCRDLQRRMDRLPEAQDDGERCDRCSHGSFLCERCGTIRARA